MLTVRGWWFLIVVTFVLVVGAFVTPYFTVVPVLLALTLLAWFVWEWVGFHLRSNAAVSRLKVRRWVIQGGRETPMLWAGVPFEVKVRLQHDGIVGIQYAVVEDRLPVAADLLAGTIGNQTSITRHKHVELSYTLKCPAPGIVRFEGVKVRVADLHGFFYRRVFLRTALEFLVLPPLVDDEGRQRADKRFNTLPPPGVHRLRRPGSGSELLDLRDYRPGDPPKMIAWKASAKKGTLITKEYENDVPVRCVLFLDTSESVRLGPTGNTLLTRMAGIAAVVSQAAAANRDLVGLTTFDDQTAHRTPPARTQTHIISLLQKLAEVSALQPSTKGVPVDHLTRRAYPLAHELYPEAMKTTVNTMPLGRKWIPLLDRQWAWIILLMVVLPPAMFTYKMWTVFDKELPRIPQPVKGIYEEWMKDTFVFAVKSAPRIGVYGKIAWVAIVWPLAMNWPTLAGLLFWFIYGFRGWFGTRAAELMQRKQLAALFSLQDGTGPDAIERYIHDDDFYAARVGKFLEHHLLRCPMPLYDEYGRYRFRCERKAEILGTEILRAVGMARDNELYVILADLAELGDELEPLVKACRVARARRHHVMVIVPWPADVPSPDEAPAPAPDDAKKRSYADNRDGAARHRQLSQIVLDNLTRQYHQSFKAMRYALSSVGATVMRVSDGDPVRLVLDRLDRVRGMRSRR